MHSRDIPPARVAMATGRAAEGEDQTELRGLVEGEGLVEMKGLVASALEYSGVLGKLRVRTAIGMLCGHEHTYSHASMTHTDVHHTHLNAYVT